MIACLKTVLCRSGNHRLSQWKGQYLDVIEVLKLSYFEKPVLIEENVTDVFKLCLRLICMISQLL